MLIVKVYDTAVYAQDFKYETLIIMLFFQRLIQEEKQSYICALFPPYPALRDSILIVVFPPFSFSGFFCISAILLYSMLYIFVNRRWICLHIFFIFF